MSQKTVMILVSIALVWYFLKGKREEALVKKAFPGEDKLPDKSAMVSKNWIGGYAENTIRDYTASRY